MPVRVVDDARSQFVRSDEPVVAFQELKELPAHLKLHWTVVVVLAAVAAAGLTVGALVPATHPAQSLLSSTFFCAAGLYLVISIIDFREHFRLEKALTGRMLAARAVPLGESINHAGSVGIILLTLLLPRPLNGPLEARDVVALLLPLAFLALGLRDEVVYHRRRSAHREDILHTTAHLCAGAMFAAWMPLRLVSWAVAR